MSAAGTTTSRTSLPNLKSIRERDSTWRLVTHWPLRCAAPAHDEEDAEWGWPRGTTCQMFMSMPSKHSTSTKLSLHNLIPGVCTVEWPLDFIKGYFHTNSKVDTYLKVNGTCTACDCELFVPGAFYVADGTHRCHDDLECLRVMLASYWTGGHERPNEYYEAEFVADSV